MKNLNNNIVIHTENYLKNSNTELHEKLKYLVRTERKILITILDHLSEVKRRRIYAELGYSSLFNYCVKELNYSESAALRRIQALKLTEELPEIKDKLNSGVLNLSTVSMAQTFFQKEKSLCEIKNPDLPLLDSLSVSNHKVATSPQFKDKSRKLEFLKSLENKTTKEAQKEMVKLSPEAALTFETQKPITENLTELKLTLNETQLKKLNQLKALRSDFRSTAELLEWLLDQSLKKMDLNQVKENSKEASNPAQSYTTATKIINKVGPVFSNVNLDKNAQKAIRDEHEAPFIVCNTNLSKKLSDFSFKNNSTKKISIKKQVYMKSKGQCSFVAKNGHKCLETHGLEIDHIFPKAKGGNDSVQNLRLLCKAHNQLEAIRHFGMNHMKNYLK